MRDRGRSPIEGADHTERAAANYDLKEVAGNEELITIAAPQGEQIDGQATMTIGGVYALMRVISDGAKWLRV